MYYDELETRVRLSKRRQKIGQQPNNTRLVVRHRPLNAGEFKMQRYREKQLEPAGDEDEEEERGSNNDNCDECGNCEECGNNNDKEGRVKKPSLGGSVKDGFRRRSSRVVQFFGSSGGGGGGGNGGGDEGSGNGNGNNGSGGGGGKKEEP